MKTFEYLEKYFPNYYSDDRITILNDLAAYVDKDITLSDLNSKQTWTRGLFPDTLKREFDSRLEKAKEYALNNQIDKAYNAFIVANDNDPSYAICLIQYPEESPIEVTIKMSSDVNEQDDEDIFFYCNCVNGFLFLTKEGTEEFKIVEFINFE